MNTTGLFRFFGEFVSGEASALKKQWAEEAKVYADQQGFDTSIPDNSAANAFAHAYASAKAAERWGYEAAWLAGTIREYTPDPNDSASVADFVRKFFEYKNDPANRNMDLYNNGKAFEWGELPESELVPKITDSILDGTLISNPNDPRLWDADLWKSLDVLWKLLKENLWDEIVKLNPELADFFTRAQQWIFPRDPLTLDLDGDGIETVAVSSTNPILFDHDGDGLKNATGWIKPDDGLLVMDRNGNGTIDNGTELFGDSTNLYGGGKAADGFAALAQEDTNGDGKIGSADANFAYLRVWRDLNQNGISESGELATLASLNIASIDIAKKNNSQPLPGGNEIADLGTYTKTDGSTGTVGEVMKLADVNLAVDTFHRQFPDSVPLAAGVTALPNMQGSGLVRDLWEAMSQSADLKSLVAQFAGATTKAAQMAIMDPVLGARPSARTTHSC